MNAKKPITPAIALLILGTVFLSTGVYFCLKPELYRAVCRIKPNRDIGPALGENIGAFDPYFIQTEFEVLQSEPVLDKVINALDLNTAWAHKAGKGEKLKTAQSRRILRNRLELRPVQNTGLIVISFSGDNQVEAASIANVIAETYRDFCQVRHKERTVAAIKSLEVQLDEVKGKIKKFEDLARDTNEPEPAAVPKVAATPVAVSTTTAHDNQLRIDADAEYLKQEKLLDELKLLTPAELRQAIPAVAPDETLSRLLQERAAAENQLIALGQELDETDPAPELQRATQAVASLDTLIDERSQAILAGMKARAAALKTVAENAAIKIEESKPETNSLQKGTETLPRHQDVRLAYELRELQHTRSVLELRLSKLPLAKSPQVEIISRAEPPGQPIFPNHAIGIILMVAAITTDGAGLWLLNSNRRRRT